MRPVPPLPPIRQHDPLNKNFLAKKFLGSGWIAMDADGLVSFHLLKKF